MGPKPLAPYAGRGTGNLENGGDPLNTHVPSEMRRTGVEVVGDVPWGTHFCLFYETKADLLEVLVSYCKAGLESHEFCLWIVAPPLTQDEALRSMWQAVPDFDRYRADGSIEVLAARDWYLQDGAFDLKRVIAGWNEKLTRASAKGYVGVRVTGDTAWLERKDWKDFCEYEESLNEAIVNQHLAVLCTYPLGACGASEILDVVRTHQFAVTRRRGDWDIIETAGHKKAKAEIKRLNEELEQRVIDRTSALMAANQALTREIFERQRAEDALRRSEAYLADAQRLTHTGSWAWTVTTRKVIHWSAECFCLYGFDPQLGFPSWEQWERQIHPDDRHQRQQTIEQAIRERTDYELDYRAVLPDGAIRQIHSLAHPVFNACGDLVEFVGTAMDITEQKQAEEQRERLRQSQADLAYVTRVTTLGELTASLAHEIKQPISAAVTDANTCLRWLSRDRPDVAEARESAARIVKDAMRASEIIIRIGSLFKKGIPQGEAVDVNKIIEEMIALLRSEASRFSISIRSELVQGAPKVLADRVQLQQVVMNLMLNGIDAMEETRGTRELVVKSQIVDSQLEICVSDSGRGIPPEVMDRIFTAFFTTKPQGIGMGLAISRSIIESHSGRLWATNNNPGPGASFHFTLPMAAAAGA